MAPSLLPLMQLNNPSLQCHLPLVLPHVLKYLSILSLIESHQFCRCTDFAGISFLFGFSPISSIYYRMYCYFEVAELYLTAMILGALIVFPISFTERFQDRARPMLRVGIYFCLAVLTVVPLTHMTIN